MPTKYLVSQVEGWRADIAALPPPDPGRRKVGKQQAISMMAKELHAAVRQGYTREELVEVLATKGLDVHGETLKVALGKTRRKVVAVPLRAMPRPSDGSGELTGKNPEATTDSEKVVLVRADDGAAKTEPRAGPVAGVATEDSTGQVPVAAGYGQRDRPRGNQASATGSAANVRGGDEGVKVGGGAAVIAESVQPATGGLRDIATASEGNERRGEHGTGSSGAADKSEATRLMREGPGDDHPSSDASLPAARPPRDGAGRSQGESEDRKAEAASGLAPDKRMPAAEKQAWASRASAPPGRGTFTPRKDSENI